MFVALNETGERIFAERSLSKSEEYRCPVCKGKVRLRVGDNNAPHFAHITSCTDDFSYDMSEWHREWQMLFHPNNRERVIACDNEIHRADVGCYGTVIEFQHSPISESEFWRRNDFYVNAGYDVVWIFDLIEVVNSRRMWCEDDWEGRDDEGGKFCWKYPWRFLRDFLPQNENRIRVFFQIVPFGEDPKSADEVCYMERVVWVNPRSTPLWGRFNTSTKITNYAELLVGLRNNWEKKKKLL